MLCLELGDLFPPLAPAQFKRKVAVANKGTLKFNFPILFSLSCFLVLLFYRSIDFGTKFAGEAENAKAKICALTGSEWYFGVWNCDSC